MSQLSNKVAKFKTIMVFATFSTEHPSFTSYVFSTTTAAIAPKLLTEEDAQMQLALSAVATSH
jgi:hypothetical protein